MKTKEEVKPNYAPIYAAALYPDLAKIFINHGYALAVHGSLARDFDLVAIPWTDKPSEPKFILEEITKTFSIELLDNELPTAKEHGRIAYTISVGFGQCAIDLSFFPDLIK